MAGRPKIFDEAKALEKASNLFWAKGYEASSTEDLIAVMGLQRGSFYNTFGSKKALFIKALDLHEDAGLVEMESYLAASENPVQAIKDMFLSLPDCPPDEDKLGCFAGNTIAELSGIDEELADNARRHLKNMENMLFTYIHQAQGNGQLKTKTDPALLARHMLNLWNGFNITRRIYTDKEELRKLIQLNLELLY